MSKPSNLQLLPYQSLPDSAVTVEWIDPAGLSVSDWGESSSVSLKARILATDLASCGLERFRAGITWRCDSTNQGGANWIAATPSQLSDGVEVELRIYGSEAEEAIHLQTVLLADEGYSERLKPKWAGSVIWARTDELRLGQGWGFPVACGEFTSGKYAGTPWYLDVDPASYDASLFSGPLLVINTAHADGQALQRHSESRPDLVNRVAADVLRALVLGLILNPQDEDSEEAQNSFGDDLAKWLCHASGAQTVKAFADRLRNSPGDLDRLINTHIYGGSRA